MDIAQIIRLPRPSMKVKAEVREVVHEHGNRSQILMRVRLSGWHFPERALEPFLVIGDTASIFVRIGPDGTYADAYFDVRPPRARRVSFGYGRVISWDFDVTVDPTRVQPLDRKRLPRGIVPLRSPGRSLKRK